MPITTAGARLSTFTKPQYNLRQRLNFEKRFYALEVTEDNYPQVNLASLTTFAHKHWGTRVFGHEAYNAEVDTLKASLLDPTRHVSDLVTALNTMLTRAASLHELDGDDGSPFNRRDLGEMKVFFNTLKRYQHLRGVDRLLGECPGFANRDALVRRGGDLPTRYLFGEVHADGRVEVVAGLEAALLPTLDVGAYNPVAGAGAPPRVAAPVLELTVLRGGVVPEPDASTPPAASLR